MKKDKPRIILPKRPFLEETKKQTSKESSMSNLNLEPIKAKVELLETIARLKLMRAEALKIEEESEFGTAIEAEAAEAEEAAFQAIQEAEVLLNTIKAASPNQ